MKKFILVLAAFAAMSVAFTDDRMDVLKNEFERVHSLAGELDDSTSEIVNFICCYKGKNLWDDSGEYLMTTRLGVSNLWKEIIVLEHLVYDIIYNRYESKGGSDD